MSLELLMKGLETIEGTVTGLAANVNEKLPGLDARLTELEQKGAGDRAIYRPGGAAKTLGDEVANNDAVRAFAAKGGKGKVELTVKNMITSSSDSAGALVAPDRRDIVSAPQRRLTIRDLLPKAMTASNLIEYPREETFTNLAEIVSEGSQKPESEVAFELMNAPVRTIAHWMRASRQIMADAPALAGFVNNKLIYGLKFIEELQLLKGDGIGNNLTGLTVGATAFAAPFSPRMRSKIDDIALAIAQLQAMNYSASGIVMNPLDWWKILSIKDEIGLYVASNPLIAQTPQLWGIPVVATLAMDEGEFMVGDFQSVGMILDRAEVSIEVSNEDRDNFVKNLVTILCEERLALALFQPEAVILGEFTVPTGEEV